MTDFPPPSFVPYPDAGIPPGGAAGQVLTKTSSADYAVAWADATRMKTEGEEP